MRRDQTNLWLSLAALVLSCVALMFAWNPEKFRNLVDAVKSKFRRGS